jgi:hypothetical protein
MKSDDIAKLVQALPKTSNWTKLVTKGWVHQKRAVEFLDGYLKRTRQHKRNAALVRMPTGSGKTGVMALVANFLGKKRSNILIVAPAEFLTGQIRDALNHGFWIKVGKRPSAGPKPATVMVPSTLSSILRKLNGDPAIYVCTTQTLFMLHSNSLMADGSADKNEDWAEGYAKLRTITDLVVVDEGHREPAKEWAKAVRSFAKPTILFTATPYRNDLRFFKVGAGPKYRHTFTFQKAVESGVIRAVDFKDDHSFAGQPKKFVGFLLDFFYGDFKALIPAGVTNPKVIIRCEDFTSVEEIRKNLIKALLERDRPDKVLAVHDRFEKGDEKDNKFHSVPREHKGFGETDHASDTTFWVHQFKLTEGLDDPDFCLLAFFQPFPNARGLVQQIGRLLRNPGLQPGQKAIVFSDPTHGLREQWQGYLEFERSGRSIVGPEEIVERFLQSLPEWFYAGGRYRKAADFETDDSDDRIIWEDLSLPKSAAVYRVPTGLQEGDVQRLVESLSETLEDRDMIAVKTFCNQAEEGWLGAVLSWRIVQSDALSRTGFFDVSFVPSVLYLYEGFLFYSGPISLGSLGLDELLSRIGPMEMEKLLGDKPTITQVSLINCDLGNASVRRRSMGARSLVDTAPGLSDHFHYVSTAVGTVDRNGVKTRRYLGLSRARVTETDEDYRSVGEFIQWARGLVQQLKRDSIETSPVFLRFAKNVPSPAAAKAAHMLLDLVDFFDVFAGLPPLETFPDTFKATACDVDTDGGFECEVGDKQVKGRVNYASDRKRFVVESPDLDEFELKSSEPGSKRESGSAYFSNRGVMRIVTTEGQLYADGHFYEPRRPLWGDGRIDQLGLLVGVADLNSIKTEKGEEGKIGKGTWQKHSLFHFIDESARPAQYDSGNGLFALGSLRPDTLVCDDLGTEFADFIAVDRRRAKIALIHAKQYASDPTLSASNFQVVHSQATKNLEFFNPTGSVAPDRGEKWSHLWKWSADAPDNKGLRRIRNPKDGTSDGAALFYEIQELIRKTSTQKEVWIVLGRGFSADALSNQLKLKERPPYHIVHLVYLLQSCNSNVSSVGARLKVFTVT